mmetsp:Transcript_93922/g.269210  ORF Transcript_93922/g.269210 Transcript_93922/m.269210 type:complete len:231 (+) Transcript_93922:741-1433(+)
MHKPMQGNSCQLLEQLPRGRVGSQGMPRNHCPPKHSCCNCFQAVARRHHLLHGQLLRNSCQLLEHLLLDTVGSRGTLQKRQYPPMHSCRNYLQAESARRCQHGQIQKNSSELMEHQYLGSRVGSRGKHRNQRPPRKHSCRRCLQAAGGQLCLQRWWMQDNSCELLEDLSHGRVESKGKTRSWRQSLQHSCCHYFQTACARHRSKHRQIRANFSEFQSRCRVASQGMSRNW